MNSIKKVCVFCASSAKVDREYLLDAGLLGFELARNGIEVVYGAGASGLMGKLADSVLSAGGRITGIIPGFMKEMNWAHNGLTDLIEVKSMHERKSLMLNGVDAVVGMPGGIGTLEELTEVITLKQLGQFHAPIVILNTRGFYDKLLGFFDQMIRENFMRHRHKDIWTIVERPSEVIPAILRSGPWDNNAIYFAAIQDDD